jgi:hypothetical protein
MAIIEDYAAIAGELRRVRVERQLERAEIAASIGVLRDLTRYSCRSRVTVAQLPVLKSGPDLSLCVPSRMDKIYPR